MESAIEQMRGSYPRAVSEQTTATDEKPAALGPGSQSAYHEAANAYRREHLLNLTPVQVIKKLYDVAIMACKKNDAHLAQRAITQLMLGLNFEYEEMAVGLYGLYQYAKECIRKGDCAAAAGVLEELRAAWEMAFKL